MVIVAGHITGDPEQREATTTEHIDEFSASGGHPVVGKGRDDLGQPGDHSVASAKGAASGNVCGSSQSSTSGSSASIAGS